MPRKTASLLLLVTLVLALPGCGSRYVVQGCVVAGEFSMLDFVPAQDPRLGTGQPVQGAKILIYRDATRGNERVVASGTANAAGQFSIPVSEFGAGWMVEQWRIEAYRSGYMTADQIVTLPEAKANRMLLVVMSPGRSIRQSDNDPMSQYDRFK